MPFLKNYRGFKKENHMRKNLKNYLKEYIYSKFKNRKNTFTGSGYKGKGNIQNSTYRFNKLRK